MTPDPTTQDPAASLARCIELAAKATPGEWQAKNEYDWDEIIGAIDGPDEGEFHYTSVCVVEGSGPAEHRANAALIPAAVNFLRDAAPALLAEVEAAKAAATRWEKWYHESCDVTREWIASNKALHARAEAAEQVARDQAAELDYWRTVHADDMDRQDGDSASHRQRLAIFLAHHGARTGESNEG